MLSSGHEHSFICSLSFNVITVLKNTIKKKCTPTASCSLSKYGLVSTLHVGWLGMALMALQHGHSSVSSCWFYVWLLASTPIIYKLCWFWECHLSSMPLFLHSFLVWLRLNWFTLNSDIFSHTLHQQNRTFDSSTSTLGKPLFKFAG